MFPHASFPPGTIVLLYDPDPGQSFFTRLVRGVALAAIRAHQRILYPKSKRTGAIHAVIKRPDGKWFSVTSPRAVLLDVPCHADERARAIYWIGCDLFTSRCWDAFNRASDMLVGKPYDYGQLADIAINRLFGWSPKPRRILDLGKKRTVCSAGCMIALYAGWQQLPPVPLSDRTDYPKPNTRRDGSLMFVEHTPPAFFDCNEPRYVLWSEQNF